MPDQRFLAEAGRVVNSRLNSTGWNSQELAGGHTDENPNAKSLSARNCPFGFDMAGRARSPRGRTIRFWKYCGRMISTWSPTTVAIVLSLHLAINQLVMDNRQDPKPRQARCGA